METTAYTHAPLPSELLHKIIMNVLADSIHAICVSPDVNSWDMDVVWILAGTCFKWKAIVRDILAAAFPSDSVEGKNESDSKFFHRIHLKLKQLRVFGVRSREPFTTTLFSQSTLFSDSCPFAHSYSLYLTSTALRHHDIQQEEPVAQATTVDAMRTALKMCENVMPRGLTRALVGALQKQMLMVEFGNAIAKVPVDLEGCFSRLSLPSSSVFNEDGIRTEMQNALQLVENTACPSCHSIDPNAPDVRELLEVSGIIDPLKKYRGISLVLNMHDLWRRADRLIEQWCKGTSEY